MSVQITANELKVKGVTAIEEVINENDGAIITIRGVEKYIVLRIDDYNKLREFELEAAIQESKTDIENGRVFGKSILEHIERVANV